MIDINLVPTAARKKSGSGVFNAMHLDIPREILLGVGGGCITVLVLVHVLLLALMGIKAVMLANGSAQWQHLAGDKKNIDDLNTAINDIKKQTDHINDAAAAKASVSWSYKLNVLSDNLTKGMWFKKFSLDPGSLTIEGSVFSRAHQEMETIGAFVAALRKDESFMQSFEGVEVNSVHKEKRGTLEVFNFTLVAKLK